MKDSGKPGNVSRETLPAIRGRTMFHVKQSEAYSSRRNEAPAIGPPSRSTRSRGRAERGRMNLRPRCKGGHPGSTTGAHPAAPRNRREWGEMGKPRGKHSSLKRLTKAQRRTLQVWARGDNAGDKFPYPSDYMGQRHTDKLWDRGYLDMYFKPRPDGGSSGRLWLTDKGKAALFATAPDGA